MSGNEDTVNKNTRDNRRWLSLESANIFNFNNLVVKVKKNLQEKYPDIKGAEYIDLIHKTLNTFRLNNQKFEYNYIKNGFGYKWFIQCPKCDKPSFKLYLPVKAKDREQLYLCRMCHKLKHASLLLANSKRYKKVVKPLKQLERIRAQLLKRNHTNDRTKELLDEYERIEKELASSPEYRLWKFQKEHGIQI
jgi:hypothetical protein